MSAENTADKQRTVPGVPFQPGQSGNPAGRPKGSRNKLGEAFIADLHEDWTENGKAALVACRTENPAAYVKVVASLLPKDVNLNVNSLAEFSDSELAAAISALTASIEASTRGSLLEGEEGSGEPASGVQAVH